jgi:hypothetical protein
MNSPAPLKVSVDNYLRAETSIQFARMAKNSVQAGGFAHARQVVPIAQQSLNRMNRDTIYSSTVVDISAGATLTVPKTDGRYLSVAVIDENNYTQAIFHDEGQYALSRAAHGTDHVALVARILVNPEDPQDMASAHKLQNLLSVKANSSRPYVTVAYDKDSLTNTRNLLQQLGKDFADANYCSGKPDEVRETRHMIGAAMGWGGLPTSEVVYFIVGEGLPADHFCLTLKDVPVDGFWSLSVYNKDGFFEENPFNAYTLNNVMAQQDQTGSYTIHFGPEKLHMPNFLYVMDGWSLVVRLYRPHAEVQQGDWQLPELVPLQPGQLTK